MKRTIGLQELNDHFSGKKSIVENRKLFEDGTALHKPYLHGQPAIQTQKIEKIIAYFYDIELLPVTYQLDYHFKVLFNYRAIDRDYSTNINMDNNIDLDADNIPDDDEIEQDIEKNLKAQPVKKKLSKEKIIVDYNAFYHDYYNKKLPVYAVSKKLQDLIRERTLDMGEFEIVAVNYSQLDEKALFNQFSANHKKGKLSKLPYGYSITIGAKDKQSQINTTELAERKRQLAEFARKFTEIFEREILDRTRYYDFVKK